MAREKFIFLLTILFTYGAFAQVCKIRTACNFGSTLNYNCRGVSPRRTDITEKLTDQRLVLKNCEFSQFDMKTLIENSSIRAIKIMYTSKNLDISFRNISSLCTLSVHNSRTGSLFRMRFQDMPNLTTLEIVGHEFTIFPAKPFRNLASLEALTLKIGTLMNLPKDIFYGLDVLLNLDLSFNEIIILQPNTFSNLKCLRKLLLTNNKIDVTDAALFSGLNNLNILNLERNEIKHLPLQLFRYMPNLAWLTMEENVGIEEIPPGFFSGASILNRLDISHCSLKFLNNLSFYDSQFVHHNFPTREFRGVRFKRKEYFESLQTQHFSEVVNNDSFIFPSKRSTYDFQINTAYGLNNLQQLDLSSNRLPEIEDGTFITLRRLLQLDLSNNPLRRLPQHLPFGPSELFDAVNLSHCQLSEIPNIDWTNVALHNMDISYNALINVTLPVYSKSSLILNLDYNNIENIQLDFNNVTYNSPKYSFLGSSLICDCNLKTFFQFIHSPRQMSHHVFSSDSLQQKCRAPNDTVSLIDVQVQSLSCDPVKCVLGCVCTEDKNQKVDLNCSNRNFTYAPLKLPPRVVTVHLRNNKLTSIYNSDPSWDNVNYLYLSGNRLSSLNGLIISSALRLLAVDGNKLENLPATLTTKIDTIPNFTLYLLGNNWKCECRFVDLIKWMKNNKHKIADYSRLTCKYHLTNNTSLEILITDVIVDELCYFPPNVTTTESSTPSQTSVQTSQSSTPRQTSVQTSTSSTSRSSAETSPSLTPTNGIDFDISTIEPTEQIIVPLPTVKPTDGINTIVSVILPIILIVACLAFFVYRHRHTVLAVMYAHKLYCKFLDYRRKSEDLMYDGFLCYVLEDSYIANAIVRRLEPEYRICLHERDWLMEGAISRKILHSIRNSRITIMLLSRNFILSTWFQDDFRTAYHHMPQDFLLKVVPIYIGDYVGIGYLPEDLRHLLSLKTHIKWRESFFWERLRFALRRSSGNS